MSKVCDGLRGDAFVAAHEVGFDNLCEIVDGIPQGIDTLIQHVSGMVFHLTEHASNELFRQYCRPGGPLSRQNGESMKQHVSRRRRCWIFMSGLTREERIMVQRQRRIKTRRHSEHLLVPRKRQRQAHWQRKIRDECSSRELQLR